MKIFVAAMLISGAMVGVAPASGQTRGGFKVDAEVFDYAYRERFEGQTAVSEHGVFGAGRLGYVETIGSGAFLRAELLGAFGSVDYRSDDGESLANLSQDILQLDLQVGRDFPLGGGTTLTPFVGLGARLLTDENGGRETGSGLLAYDRNVSYSYASAGAAASFRLAGRTNLILSGQYNRILNGYVRSDLSQVDVDAPNLTLDLDKGHGLEASAMLHFGVGGSRLGVGPFVRHWKVGQSDTAVFIDPEDPSAGIAFFEPRNRTTELGLRLSWSF